MACASPSYVLAAAGMRRNRQVVLTFLTASAMVNGCSDREPPALAPVDHQVVDAKRHQGELTPRNPAPTTTAQSLPEVRPNSGIQQSEGGQAAGNSGVAVSGGGQSAQAISTSPSAPLAPPTLVDPSGRPLEQTEELPSLTSSTFTQRMARLLAAIASDSNDSADIAFFPVSAYEQVKAIANPARDHRLRLLAAYHRNIHEYHQKVRHYPKPLTFVGVKAGSQPSRWMKPNTEGNRIGYHRLLRSQLKFSDGAGAVHALTLTSLISWRGEWYVVHLDGFK